MPGRELLTGEIFNVLSMSDNPLSIPQIQGRIRVKATQSDIRQLLSTIITKNRGIGYGYQPGTFYKADDKYSVDLFGGPLTPKRAIELML